MKPYFNLFCVTLCTLIISVSCTYNKGEYIMNEGAAQGTSYHIIYQSPDSIDYHDSIKHILKEFDMSLSSYVPNSIISRINKNDTTAIPDKYFMEVYKKSEEAYTKSDGLFDITVGPLVNAWGFGPERRKHMDSTVVDSILQFIGMEKLALKNGKIIKKDSRIKLDVNAIAQGYSCDVIALFLERRGIHNYLVEIGGEVNASGKNPDNKSWRIGIDRPEDGNLIPGKTLQTVVALKNRSLATSGNYRKFIEENGVKYAHTINPKTGYPVLSNLLSATIVADDCMTADAYATICMVAGLEKSIDIINKTPELDAYLIYSNEKGEFKVFSTKGMDRMTDPGPAAFAQ